MNYSVLMTVYKNDNPSYLKKSMLSILNQSILTNDFIVVKDGPITEELQNVIDLMDEEFPSIIKQVDLKVNVGLGLALNEGLKVCKNDIVARMDADDISLSTRCELQLQEFEKDIELDIVGCDVDEFMGDEDNIICTRSVPGTNEDIYRYAKQRDPFNHPTVMYKKKKILALGGYKDLRKNQDTDLWLRMLMSGCKGKNINQSLLLFRFEDETYKRRKNWLNTKSLINIRYHAFREGFSGFGDFSKICIMQILIYVMPIKFQRWIYRNFLRTTKR
ncbi:glycosyltransferase [Bacillus toyonensis]|uniref:glycosyltransferase n=1 Tax=Bacillus toyonensis TaxID=155322 RepID=UPI003D64EA7C